MNRLLKAPQDFGQAKRARASNFFRNAALLVTLLFSLPLVSPNTNHDSAQAQGITGSITGTVTDPSGAPIAGATVTVIQLSTSAVHTITTSDAGNYTVPQLPPGCVQWI
jgi:hypothetical protein